MRLTKVRLFLADTFHVPEEAAVTDGPTFTHAASFIVCVARGHWFPPGSQFCGRCGWFLP